MKTHLFYTFLVIFAATAVLTLLGVTNVIVIREGYLTALVTAFLIEIAGAVIAIFKSANFFDDDHKGLSAEAGIANSIRKLDSGIGLLYRRLKEQEIHFDSRLLGAQHLRPTPETDTMVLIASIEKNVGNVDPELIKEALGVIADVLEKNTHIGSYVRAHLASLVEGLPTEFTGQGKRILQIVAHKTA